MPIKLKKHTLEHLAQLHTRATATNSLLGTLRNRFAMVDMAIERTSEVTLQKLQSIRSAELGRKDRLRNMEVPLMAEKVDTLQTKLVDKLLTGYPVFAMVGQKGNKASIDVANQYTALMEQDQERFGWQAELMDTLNDAVRYNVAAVELSWAQGRTSSLVLRTAGATRVAESADYSGILLRNLDKYNFVFDTTVPLHQLQSKGVFAGYIERLSFLGVYELLNELNPEYKLQDHISSALLSPTNMPNYFEPMLHPLEANKQQPSQQVQTDWAAHFGFNSADKNGLPHTAGKYEVFTLYYRCIPMHIGITAKDAGDDIDVRKSAVLKLVFIGTKLVYAQPMSLAYGGLPIFAAHLRNGQRGFGVNSFAEDLEDLQDSASAMLNGSIASMRKAVSDRMLYDPRYIKSEDINSANPSSKIPVRVFGMGTKLGDTFAVVPYRDDISQWLFQHMQLTNQMADSVSGVNRATQGNFTKGNRTMQEFNTVMDNSEARLHKYAINIEARLFAPLKQAIKLLYLQNVSSQDIVSRTLETTVKVNPTEMLKYEVTYRMADGLNSVGKQLNTDVLTAALNTIAQSPVLATRYDVAGIFSELMAAGRIDIGKYEIPQQPQQGTPTGATNGA